MLAETAEIVRGGRGRGEMQEGRTNREKREQGKEEKRKEKWWSGAAGRREHSVWNQSLDIDKC